MRAGISIRRALWLQILESPVNKAYKQQGFFFSPLNKSGGGWYCFKAKFSIFSLIAFPSWSHDGCSASGKVSDSRQEEGGWEAPATSVPFIKRGCPRNCSADFRLYLTDHSCVTWRPAAKEAEKLNTLPASKVEVGKEKEV